MSAMFRSFSERNYRLWFVGAFVSNTGGWMQATAQDWVVLTELTAHDALAMGVTMALQFGPPLLLVGLTGWVADRFDRRVLLMVTQVILMLLAIVTGVLLLTGVMTLAMMFLFALAFGIANAFDSPARQAFVSDIVPRPLVANAVALNSASFNLARMLGPAVAGLIIVMIGSGWVFFVNALTFVAMLLALWMIRTSAPPASKTSGSQGLGEGLRYVARRPDLIVTFVMIFLIGAFALNFPVFASTMALEFGRQADGYGLLSSIVAIGSLMGALLAARRERARFRVLLASVGGLGATLIASAFAPTFWTYAAVLVLVGFTSVTALTTANGYIQTNTAPAVRGRVLALYMAVVLGSSPVGAPIAGWIADALGPRAAIIAGGIGSLVAFAVGLVWLITSGRLHVDRRLSFTVDDTRPTRVVTAQAPIIAQRQFSDASAQTSAIATIPGGQTPRE